MSNLEPLTLVLNPEDEFDVVTTNDVQVQSQIILQEQIQVLPKFTLTVGLEYKTFSREITKIVYTFQNRFLGVIELPGGPMQIWYTSDGMAERDFDVCPEQDPFDVKCLHRDPDTIYLLKIDNSYTSNNAFMTRDAAVKAASERGGMVIPFKEVMDD